MRRIAFLFALAAYAAAFAANVTKARFGDLPMNAQVVTDVDLSGLSMTETDPTVPAWAKDPEPPVTGVSAETVTSIVADVTNGIPRITESEVYEGWAAKAEDSLHADWASEAASAETAISADNASYAERSGQANFAEGAAYADWTASLAGETQSIRRGDEIFDQLDAATATNAMQSSQMNTLGSQVSAIGAHLNAEDARFIATNYNSETRMAEAYVEVKLTNGWFTIWREMTRWNWFLGIYNADHAAIIDALADKGEKEYAFYDGVTGQPAPDGFFWISQPRVAIAGGMSYQRYIDSGGAVWVLESNGMVADINGTTNGYFRISDDEGNSQFEIVKGSSRTVAAAPGAVTHSAVMSVTHWFTTYAVTNATSAPVAMFCRNLASQAWLPETDANCPCNVSWTSPDSGTYVCEWWAKSAEPMMFMKAEYGQGSESRVVNFAPVEIQTIVVGDAKYTLGTATINGITVLTATRQ